MTGIKGWSVYHSPIPESGHMSIMHVFTAIWYMISRRAWVTRRVRFWLEHWENWWSSSRRNMNHIWKIKNSIFIQKKKWKREIKNCFLLLFNYKNEFSWYKTCKKEEKVHKSIKFLTQIWKKRCEKIHFILK